MAGYEVRSLWHWGLIQDCRLLEGSEGEEQRPYHALRKDPGRRMGALAHDFNPTRFDADAWVLAAKNAGMKYIVITSKHHDGLAMYDSPAATMTLWTRVRSNAIL